MPLATSIEYHNISFENVHRNFPFYFNEWLCTISIQNTDVTIAKNVRGSLDFTTDCNRPKVTISLKKCIFLVKSLTWNLWHYSWIYPLWTLNNLSWQKFLHLSLWIYHDIHKSDISDNIATLFSDTPFLMTWFFFNCLCDFVVKTLVLKTNRKWYSHVKQYFSSISKSTGPIYNPILSVARILLNFAVTKYAIGNIAFLVK